MTIKEIIKEKYATLVPEGDLDANSSIIMDEHVRSLMERKLYNVHVDCSKLQYISSAGLGVFISFLDELKLHGGKFVFTGMTESIYKVFELLGLHEIMTILKDESKLETAFE